jgi:hypothetical protein
VALDQHMLLQRVRLAVAAADEKWLLSSELFCFRSALTPCAAGADADGSVDDAAQPSSAAEGAAAVKAPPPTEVGWILRRSL